VLPWRAGTWPTRRRSGAPSPPTDSLDSVSRQATSPTARDVPYHSRRNVGHRVRRETICCTQLECGLRGLVTLGLGAPTGRPARTSQRSVTSAPSGPVCVECVATRGHWVRLRTCQSCGHVGSSLRSPRPNPRWPGCCRARPGPGARPRPATGPTPPGRERSPRPNTASLSRSVDTTELRWTSSIATSRRCLGPPMLTSSPRSATASPPNARYSSIPHLARSRHAATATVPEGRLQSRGKRRTPGQPWRQAATRDSRRFDLSLLDNQIRHQILTRGVFRTALTKPWRRAECADAG
jgi:hypothetical protein